MVKLQAAQGLVNAVQTVANKLQKDAILGIQLRSALQKAQNFILYGSVAATQAEATATKVATGAKVAMTGATQGANLALKLFRGALLATGIGALIVGLGLLIANFDKVVKFMQPVINGFKAIGDAIGLSDFAGEERASNEQKRSERERADLRRTIELKQRAFDNEQAAIQRTIDLYNAQGKDVEKLTRLKLENAAKFKKALVDEQEQLISNADYYAKNGTDLQRSIAQASQDIINQSTQEAKDTQNELDVFNAEQQKKRSDKAKEEAKERATNNKSLIKQIEDAQIEAIQNEDIRARAKLLKDAERSTQEINKLKANEEKKATLTKLIDEKLQRDLQALDDAALKKQQEAEKTALDFKIKQERDLLKMIEDLSEQNYLATLSDQERELLAVQDKYFELETMAQGNADALQEIEIAKANELNNINLKYQEQRDKQNEEQRQKDLKREQDILEFKLFAATETFKLISDVADLFGKKNEKAAKRAFMIQKASSIAQATIETYKGANAIFASAAANPSSILFPAQPFIAAGLAIGSGIANVAKIASQKFEGGGTPSASGDTGSVPNLTGASASSFTANTNAQTTNLSTLGQGQGQNIPVSQVVVLESDITGTQNKVKLQEAKTSF
jgi:hypothetical protein